MTIPLILYIDSYVLSRIFLIYVKKSQEENAVKQALSLLPKTVNDPLPQQVRDIFDLCDLKQALNDIHFPKSRECLEKARKRLVTEELVVLNLGMRNLREHSRGESGVKITKNFKKLYRFRYIE